VADVAAHRGLGHPQPPGCAGEAERLGHGLKALKLVEIHGSSPFRLTASRPGWYNDGAFQKARAADSRPYRCGANICRGRSPIDPRAARRAAPTGFRYSHLVLYNAKIAL